LLNKVVFWVLWVDADVENNVTYSQTFNVENMLAVVTNTVPYPAFITTFYYNGDGARVKKEEQVVGGSVTTTVYLGGVEIQVTASTRITKTYYSAGAQMIAMREVTSTAYPAGTLYYLHTDHLGSTSTTTCGNSACGTLGAVLARQSYYAYGGVRQTTGVLPTDIGYTGQRLDGTGLMYYGARYYSSLLGRFVNADTVVPGGGPQGLNRYGYVLGNPLKYTDPTGHMQYSDKDHMYSWSKRRLKHSDYSERPAERVLEDPPARIAPTLLCSIFGCGSQATTQGITIVGDGGAGVDDSNPNDSGINYDPPTWRGTRGEWGAWGGDVFGVLGEFLRPYATGNYLSYQTSLPNNAYVTLYTSSSNSTYSIDGVVVANYSDVSIKVTSVEVAATSSQPQRTIPIREILPGNGGTGSWGLKGEIYFTRPDVFGKLMIHDVNYFYFEHPQVTVNMMVAYSELPLLYTVNFSP
jgi:RHS repeat-associated protein